MKRGYDDGKEEEEEEERMVVGGLLSGEWGLGSKFDLGLGFI